MATTVISIAAPETPAPPIPGYPQFVECQVPEGSDAIHAYRGYIRSFSDDLTASRVLRAIVAEQPLIVSEGRLDSEAVGLPRDPLEDYLEEMATPCTVVVLEFSGRRHPRAFLINPLPVRRVSGSQHIWWDKTVVIDGKVTPELCVYAANLFQYDPALERLPQFLNQLSTYLAKHLIFLRTRMLCTLQKNGSVRRMTLRKPWQSINLHLLNVVQKSLWFGVWIGNAAPHLPAQHLQTIKPKDECWCNSGDEYGHCHMTKDQAYLRKTA
ncbi:hypothetical protein BH10ACI4_BH10ACI4_26030 [soil metagenome]